MSSSTKPLREQMNSEEEYDLQSPCTIPSNPLAHSNNKLVEIDCALMVAERN